MKEVAAGRQRKQEMRDKKRDEMKQRREEAKEKALEEKRTKVSIVYLSFEWHKDYFAHSFHNQFEIPNY